MRKQKIKVLYFVHDEMTYIAQAIEKYNKSNFEFYYILTDFRYYDLIDKKKSLRVFEDFDLYDYKNNPIDLPQQVLNRLYSNLMSDKNSDTSGMPLESSDYQINHALSISKKLFLYIKELSPKYILFQGPEGYYTKNIQDIADALNMQTLAFSGFRNFDTFGFYLNFEQKKAKHFYTNKISEESLKKAKLFLKDFREGENKYSNTLSKYHEDKPIIPFIKRILNNLIFLFKSETKFYIENINIFEKFFYKYWTRGVKEFYFQKKIKSFYDNVELEKIKYVFFPLHVVPEASNTMVPFWQSQIRAIDFILHSLPANYKLIIKEHPGMILSRRGLDFYQILKRKPGVVFIDKDIPSRKVIENADYVVGVNSTALLEAYFLGKKAICLADFMFSDFITKVDTVEELKRIFQTDAIIVDNFEKIQKTIAMFFEYTYENVILESPNRYSYVISQANIENFLIMLEDFINKLENS